ncbi:MAG TPA: hypothetical protein VKB50_16970 [Vicinamibacterales bacterium]|nr:hypothetical protein [Vicinamibacterales bacterium]
MHSLKQVLAGRSVLVNEEGDECKVIALEGLGHPAARSLRLREMLSSFS